MSLSAGAPRVVTLTRSDTGRRLDVVLTRHLADIAASRTTVQRWIEGGLVHVNGGLVARVSARGTAGDAVAVALPPIRARQAPAAEDLALEVVFEDDHLLAVNKPAGLVVHPTYKHRNGTLLNGLLWRARLWPDGQRPSLVNRLDRLTSGLVLVAKTPAVHARLQRSLESGEAEKDYLALTYGRVRHPRGRIELPLVRDAADLRRVAVTRTGLPSVTLFHRLGTAPGPRAGLTLLRCRLITGRMHQIRVHLAARGWPIVGDPVYGEPRWSTISDPDLADTLRAFPRQALHAWRIAVPHPVTRDRTKLEAPLPPDMQSLFTACHLMGLWPERREHRTDPLTPEPRRSRSPEPPARGGRAQSMG